MKIKIFIKFVNINETKLIKFKNILERLQKKKLIFKFKNILNFSPLPFKF